MSRSEAVCPASASSAYTAVVATALCSWRSSKAAPQAMPSLKCHTQLEPKHCDLPFELRELQTSRVLQMSQGPDLPLRLPKECSVEVPAGFRYFPNSTLQWVEFFFYFLCYGRNKLVSIGSRREHRILH